MPDPTQTIVPKLDPEEVKQALGFEEFMRSLSSGDELQKLLEPIAKLFSNADLEKKIDQILANQQKIASGINSLLKRKQ